MMKKEDLFYEKKTVYEKAGKEVVDAAFAYAEGYKAYLDAAKGKNKSHIRIYISSFWRM